MGGQQGLIAQELIDLYSNDTDAAFRNIVMNNIIHKQTPLLIQWKETAHGRYYEYEFEDGSKLAYDPASNSYLLLSATK